MTSPTTPFTPIFVEDIKKWQGDDVIDQAGEKLGKLEEVYYDAETDLPGFAAVKSGVLGKRVTLVPLAGASVGHDFVRVKATKEQVKKAPSFDPGAELSADDEASSYGYFGLDYAPAGQGARRLAKH
jgi:uncharacterized protein YrrD